MNRQINTASFAFKLAGKQAQTAKAAEWKVRDGVAVAGCTFMSGELRVQMFRTGEGKTIC